MRAIVAAFTGLLTLGVVGSAHAQSAMSETADVKRINLQGVDVPGSNYEVIVDIMEISPGKVGRHTHPGPAVVYVLEGGFTFLLDGHPPKIFRAGDSFQEPAGAVHEGFGDKPTKIIAVFVVPKGQPLVSPAK